MGHDIELPEGLPLQTGTCSQHGDNGRSSTSFVKVWSRFSELCTSCVLIDILAVGLFSGWKRTGHPWRLLRTEYQEPVREGKVVHLTS